MTACLGERTLVETIVEMELEESWKPLMKSKTSATITRKMTNAIESSMFQDNPFHGVGYVFTNINRLFDPFEDFFPFDQFDGILFLDKKIGDNGS
jgi:hypothetical protein